MSDPVLGINKEILQNVKDLSELFPPVTRGDYIRLFRAAIEMLPGIYKPE